MRSAPVSSALSRACVEGVLQPCPSYKPPDGRVHGRCAGRAFVDPEASGARPLRCRSVHEARPTAASPSTAPGHAPQASAAPNPAYKASPPASTRAIPSAAGTSRVRRNSKRTTAAITGAYVALHRALAGLAAAGTLPRLPLREPVAAVSCGLLGGLAVLDLDYAEDSTAEADANFVLTASGGIVEIQVTAEQTPIEVAAFTAMQDLAGRGIAALVALQRQALGTG